MNKILKNVLIGAGLVIVTVVGYTIYWILTDKPPERGRSGLGRD